MKPIPILLNHDPSAKPIGYVLSHADGSLRVRISKDVRITREMLFDIFGGAGIRINSSALEKDGTMVIHEGTILEFSLSRQATA